MHITWLGQTCVKLQTKTLKGGDVTILIDAYKPETGSFPRSFSPDIALYSAGNKDLATLSQEPFIIDTLGELEIKETLVSSFPAGEDKRYFNINAEGMNIVHLGKNNKKLSEKELGKLPAPDVLLVPIGGEPDYFSPSEAAEICNALEPRIIIPIAYKSDNDPKAKDVSDFIKESGLPAENGGKKIIIKKKDLPQEETKLIILEKE